MATCSTDGNPLAKEAHQEIGHLARHVGLGEASANIQVFTLLDLFFIWLGKVFDNSRLSATMRLLWPARGSGGAIFDREPVESQRRVGALLAPSLLPKASPAKFPSLTVSVCSSWEREGR